MALAETLDHLKFDDTYTNFIDIGPVNKSNKRTYYFALGNSKVL